MQNWQFDMNQKDNQDGPNPTANNSMAKGNHSGHLSNLKQKILGQPSALLSMGCQRISQTVHVQIAHTHTNVQIVKVHTLDRNVTNLSNILECIGCDVN